MFAWREERSEGVSVCVKLQLENLTSLNGRRK